MRCQPLSLLALLSIPLVSCSTSTPHFPSIKSMSPTAPPQIVPSVKDAVIKAIRLTSGYGFFNRALRTPPPGSNAIAYSQVEVSGHKQPDGSVRVLFRRPTSDRMIEAGRLPTEKLFEATFTKAGVVSKSFAQKPSLTKTSAGKANTLDEKFTRAVATVCTRFSDGNTEFSVSVMEIRKGRAKGGMLILISAIPHTPDADSIYSVSKDFKILRSD